MKHSLPSYIRVPLVFFIIFGSIEYFVDSGNQPAFLRYPIIMLFLLLVVLILIAIEAVVEALEKVMFESLDEAAKARYLSVQTKTPKMVSWVKRTYIKMLGSKPMEAEGEIILDHNYDGIRELDNDLPPWWLYGFYASIVFAFIYMLRYHVFNGDNQYDELQVTLEQAKVDLEEYKKTAKDLVDYNTVVVSLDVSDLSNGQKIFQSNCVACHMADGGGGIGPNLTDTHWILGGGIKNVFHTISEGGRSGKGMIAWKQSLKPSEIAQVANYILSLQGTVPANPKAPEGDIWTSDQAKDLN
ncbi:cbb3-type cytochrome c oxidase N-terminal domain-containing protein [Mariniflexile sp. AS56]|uniref:cbb3-type cytochrome c oxidase N-terminal domain-containing protein n=1 Tax=Mariniflexile sp. AS56 TaxID=3063957 RepID=UPI0026EA2BFC|nr:cbb3-type cytochrome c oxidase N-terminal domain-containing protein [Mariniflexile sp. AS56]MDO7171102.1 cbb3-type cytochrome c oxidase N-terminal domain-containing protein [Mariniflexile sp. AS56]